jgi:hypothetical protein
VPPRGKSASPAVRVGLGPGARLGWGVADCDAQGFQRGARSAVGGRIDGSVGGAPTSSSASRLVALAVRLCAGPAGAVTAVTGGSDAAGASDAGAAGASAVQHNQYLIGHRFANSGS